MEDCVIVDYKGVTLSRDGNVILENINLKVNKGDFVYLIGKVGSGKSTFLKSLYCEIPLDAGQGRILEFDLHAIKNKQIPFLRRKVGIVFQDFQLLIDRSVDKNLEFVLKATGWKNKDLIKERIKEVLIQVGMQNKGYKMPHELSGGEQQRVVIARALLNSPEIILADEPTGNLDPETGNTIVQLLQDISKDGTAVIMSTHNYAIVQKYPGRIIKCDDGAMKEAKIASQVKPDKEISFKKVEITDYADLEFIHKVYTASFPANERRPVPEFLNLINEDNLFTVYLVLYGDLRVGFFSFWNFDSFIFAEHFAISSEFRSGGYGKKVMEAFFKQTELPIVLEVELPENELAKRRVGFYERLGFRGWDITYEQPPYTEGHDPVPMMLMTYRDIDMKEKSENVKDTLYEHVYKISGEKKQ